MFLQFDNLNPAELNLAIEKVIQFHKIGTKVKFGKSTLGISVNFEVNFIADLCCVRCLETFTGEFNEHRHLDYIEGNDPFMKVEKMELKPSDIDKIYYTGSFIDISIGIRETIILAIPVAPLCKTNCFGLCPVCGKNLNKRKCKCQKERTGLFTLKEQTKPK